MPVLVTRENKLESIRSALPKEGLFADKDWLISPEAFPISEKFADELEHLGHRLFVFQRACNQLYQLSARGKQPEWIAKYLDAGKPAALVALSRQKIFREDLPRVIRPDLILTEKNYILAEVDSVPGGIGLTAWLNQTYSALGQDVIGGENGMFDGFQKVLPNGGDILVSNESATYRPEMEWLAKEISKRRTVRAGLGDNAEHQTSNWRVVSAENYEPQDGRDVYRFFELFDLPNIPNIDAVLSAAMEGKVRITPPIKPFLEEKMWFALFWLKPLREFWRRELGEKYFLKLREVIPYTWLLDPTPLPQHAVIPRLEIHDWREATRFSQKERDLLLKVSGFSPLGWGSRGVALGADLPHHEWEKRIEHALDNFAGQPTILQQFHKGSLFEHQYYDASAEMRPLKGRVRLCPYYFVEGDRVRMRGALTTIVPADKKLIHGMRDGIMVPTRVQES
ncbi:MAG TPA: hypothetical protein VFJ55_04640 [Chthoniobacterales bacterium]|nr:hypothetical protein [Chthoniobacterales bacterium]